MWLINPAKSELGKISKIILDQVNTAIRSSTNVNHEWRSTHAVIDWFQAINEKTSILSYLLTLSTFTPQSPKTC